MTHSDRSQDGRWQGSARDSGPFSYQLRSEEAQSPEGLQIPPKILSHHKDLTLKLGNKGQERRILGDAPSP